jgi:hypothetical protein
MENKGRSHHDCHCLSGCSCGLLHCEILTRI